MASGAPAASEGGAGALDAARIGWRHVEMQARKFAVTATSDVDIAVSDTAVSGASLLVPARGVAVAPGERIVRLAYRTGVLGKDFDTVLWLDPLTGAALQYETVTSGSSHRWRVFRYTDEGAYLWTRRPARGESARPAGEWSDRSEGFRPYPAGVVGHPVVEPVGILYAVAAADLAPGRELALLAMTGRQVSRVIAVAGGTARVDTDFQLGEGEQRQRCKGRRTATRVALRVEPLASGDADFDFLGLRSDIELLIEPRSRLPLQISGRAKLVGDLTIRLREATLTAGGGCPG